MRIDNTVAYVVTGLFVVATLIVGAELLYSAKHRGRHRRRRGCWTSQRDCSRPLLRSARSMGHCTGAHGFAGSCGTGGAAPSRRSAAHRRAARRPGRARRRRSGPGPWSRRCSMPASWSCSCCPRAPAQCRTPTASGREDRTRTTYLLVDGENIDATLGTSILGPATPPGGAAPLGPAAAVRPRPLGPGARRAVLPRGQQRAADVVRAGAALDGLPAGAAGRRAQREGRRHRDPAHPGRARRPRRRRAAGQQRRRLPARARAACSTAAAGSASSASPSSATTSSRRWSARGLEFIDLEYDVAGVHRAAAAGPDHPDRRVRPARVPLAVPGRCSRLGPQAESDSPGRSGRPPAAPPAPGTASRTRSPARPRRRSGSRPGRRRARRRRRGAGRGGPRGPRSTAVPHQRADALDVERLERRDPEDALARGRC